MDSSPVLFADDAVGLFPGQGSIAEGVGQHWVDSPHWSLVDEIAVSTGIDVESLLLDTPTEELIRTDRAQIATFALSLISYADIRARGRMPRYLLGHSLGEFSALVASGILSIGDGSRLIAARGAAMAQAARDTEGAMVAVMGGEPTDRAALEGLNDVWVANINGPGQIVLSGTPSGIEHVLSVHRELGWKRATPLNVGGAFHSPLMAAAQDELDAALAKVSWGSTEQKVLSNVDGSFHNDGADWRTLLSRQMTAPVEFLAATLALPESVTTTIEMAPSGILTGLTKRIRPFSRQLCPESYQEVQEMTL